MPSFACFILRGILRLRKPFVRWDAPVEYFRAMMDRSARIFVPPLDVAVAPASADGVACEWLTPVGASADSVLLYLHGGAWTLGWTNVHRRLVAMIAKAAGIRALAVDYRLAPEHPFPAGLDDCVAAYRWLVKNGTPSSHIVIAGDSAGGNLTAATLLTLRDAGEPLPAAAVLIGAVTNLEGTEPSYHAVNDLVLTVTFAESMKRHYAGDRDLRAPLLSPYHGDLRGLPPLLIQAGEEEILRSDSEHFAQKARAAGVDVRFSIWPKMWHVWHFFSRSLPEAQWAIDEIGGFIRERVGRRHP
jgi:acetyl esterase/lipase